MGWFFFSAKYHPYRINPGLRRYIRSVHVSNKSLREDYHEWDRFIGRAMEKDTI